MITQPPTGLVDEALRKLRMAGQMPVALATGQAGYAIGSMPAPKPMGQPPIALNNIEAPASDRPPMSLAGNVTPEPMPGAPPSLNLRQMHDELLGKSLEVKLSRQPDTGDIQELRKTVITPGQAPTGMAEAFRSPGMAPAGPRPGYAGDQTPTGMPAGLRENFGIRTNPITGEMLRGMALDTGRPPAMLTPSATDWTPAATITNRMQMTKQERAADARRPIEDQMRRDQMASGERVAKSNAELQMAKITIPQQAENERARLERESRESTLDKDLRNRLQITGLDNATRERIVAAERATRQAETGEKTAVKADEKLKKLEDEYVTEVNKNRGSFAGYPETILDYYRNTYDENGQLKRDKTGKESLIIPEREMLIDYLDKLGAATGHPAIRVRPGQENAGGVAGTPAAGAGTAAMQNNQLVTMQFPDGKRKQVPVNQKDQYVRMGGTVIL